MTDPGQTAYEARFAGRPARCIAPWSDLDDEARAEWVRVETASIAKGALIATPEMIAAAWSAWRVRHPYLSMGPGPGFSEAISAAFKARAALTPGGNDATR